MKTVQELIDMLNKVEDKTKPVLLDGCDCYGEWNGSFREMEWDFGDSKDVKSILLGR